MLFKLGQVVSTPGAQQVLAGNDDEITAWFESMALLRRHQEGDWGNVPPEDAKANDQAVEIGERILSSYEVNGERMWVITEWDRSVTTLLLPSEY